mgnify:CR=1 FL=1
MQNALSRWLLAGALSVVIVGCGQPDPEDVEPVGWDTTEEPGVSPIEEQDAGEPDAVVESDAPEAPDVGVVPNPDAQPNGSACASDVDCTGGTCLVGPAWPDGYCTTMGCGTSCDSPDEGCVQAGSDSFCAAYCASDDDCRQGYACATAPGSPGRVCIAATGLPDGSACEADGDCQGGTCLTDWPGGFCTTLGCESFEDCSRLGEENRCLRVRGPDLCVRLCTTDDECREDYVCQGFGDGTGMCTPDPAQPIDPTALENNPFDVVCQPATGGTATIDYAVAADTVAYMVTPLTPDGRRIGPQRIDLPAGSILDLQGANFFQSIPAQLYGGMNPTVVPATGHHTAQLEAGLHSYQLSTEADEICHYLLEEKAYGDTIDFNIYFVGLTGLDATSAPTDVNMQAVLAQFDAIYAASGISIGKVRYFDITGDAATAYSVLRSEADLSELVKLSQRPGSTMDDVLSTNVFFVRTLAMGGAIGISAGLPGPAGLHGTHGSGVAFTAEYMGETVDPSLGDGGVDGNVFTGQVLAHEVGHYLGLFHTSEQGGFSYDPLPDTPQCSRISLNCPDIDNLMFPFAGESHVKLTVDQSFVVGVSPLTKAAPAAPPAPTGGN